MKVLEYFRERFGIPEETFDEYGVYLGQKGRVYLGPKNLIQKPDISSIGMLMARVDKSVKPTTNFLQLFGGRADRNAIDLSKERAIAYIRGDDLEADEGSDGYVILRYNGSVLGCGFLKGKAIQNMLPKAKRQNVKFI